MTTYINPIRVEWQNDNIKTKRLSRPLEISYQLYRHT